jgi:hypothetical protein
MKYEKIINEYLARRHSLGFSSSGGEIISELKKHGYEIRQTTYIPNHKWRLTVIDGTDTRKITVEASNIGLAEERALKKIEDKYGTSNWRVIRLKRLD